MRRDSESYHGGGRKRCGYLSHSFSLSPIREEKVQLEKDDDGTGVEVNVIFPLPNEEEACPPSSSNGLMGKSLQEDDAGAIER